MTQVVRLRPPQISQHTILDKIVCTRPVREGKFNISLQESHHKTIVHCYGHGGSGWTTLFGSVQKSLELYEEALYDRKMPIRVIGSGCMGLTMAIELNHRGYKIAGIYTQNLYDLPSWKAAGYFGIVSVKTDSEERENLHHLGLISFLTYQKIARGEHPYLTKQSVKQLPVYCSAETEAGIEDLEKKGVIPKSEYVSLDFENGVIHKNYKKYTSYFAHTTTLMNQLLDQVKMLKIPIEEKKIRFFDEVKENIIFNCSGFGAKELNSDLQMTPVRGHLVALNSMAGNEHMDYMIYTKVLQDGKEERIYLFPKNSYPDPDHGMNKACQGVLGGTFIPDADRLPLQSQKELDQNEFKKILDRNSIFFHGHPFEMAR